MVFKPSFFVLGIFQIMESYAFLIIEEEHRFFSGTLFRTLFRNLIVVVFLLAIVR